MSKSYNITITSLQREIIHPIAWLKEVRCITSQDYIFLPSTHYIDQHENKSGLFLRQQSVKASNDV